MDGYVPYMWIWCCYHHLCNTDIQWSDWISIKKNKIIFNNLQNKWVIPHSQHNSNYCTMLCKDFTPSTSLKTKYWRNSLWSFIEQDKNWDTGLLHQIDSEGKKNTATHSEAYFPLFMNTDVNYNPFAAARSLSLQFMIQAVTTSFDPILVMLISSHNSSKSVWFNCANCVSTNCVCMCAVFGRIRHTVVRGVRGIFVPKPKLPICILMSLACHIKLLQWYFKPRLCFQEHYTECGMKGLKTQERPW